VSVRNGYRGGGDGEQCGAAQRYANHAVGRPSTLNGFALCEMRGVLQARQRNQRIKRVIRAVPKCHRFGNTLLNAVNQEARDTTAPIHAAAEIELRVNLSRARKAEIASRHRGRKRMPTGMRVRAACAAVATNARPCRTQRRMVK